MVLDINNIPGKKWCSRCNNIKSYDEFYKHKNKKFGLGNLCKTCFYQDYLTWKDKVYPKIICTCGRTIIKNYTKKHLNTNLHKKLFDLQLRLQEITLNSQLESRN